AEKNPQVGKAVSRLMELSRDEQTRLLAESREKLQRDIAAREYAATEKGREEGLEMGLEMGLGKGREEGREETQLAIARKALSENLPIETIQLITGLSPETIRTLRH
ncbi:MAG: hypothetical protein LBF91_03300, partial [Azoarcus sp.]|nr:hypothetical protein [Azoarcus sp.]